MLAHEVNPSGAVMSNRQRAMAVLQYESYDRLPLAHFGFWNPDTLLVWAGQGYLSREEALAWKDGNLSDVAITRQLGFDFNWFTVFRPETRLFPFFERVVLREFDDGTRHVINEWGVVVVEKPGLTSIPAEIEHTLSDRQSWEKDFKWRYQFSPRRVAESLVRVGDRMVPFDQGGREFLISDQRDYPYGLECGSLYGQIRNLLGLQGACYLAVDDEPLFDEIIETVAEECYQTTKYVLESGAKFDFGHFWEDICFKSGPLIQPHVFRTKIGPHYRRMTDLFSRHGIEIVSVDCDGCIDALVPIWLEHGVNTMFPIEVGTWGGNIAPWREAYGKQLRGVGGVNKIVFTRDRAAVDDEIERIRPLVDLGGYLPCPDHRISPDAKYDLVRYYCARMRALYG